jgi:hypothetical protein
LGRHRSPPAWWVHRVLRLPAIRQAAVQIGRRRQVSPAALSACAVLIPVQGRWWHQVEPGAVVCSVTAASDSDTARRVLDDVFESGLAS